MMTAAKSGLLKAFGVAGRAKTAGAAGEHKKRFLATVNENGLDRLESRRDNRSLPDLLAPGPVVVLFHDHLVDEVCPPSGVVLPVRAEAVDEDFVL